MRSAYQVNVVFLAEGSDYLLAKCKGHPSVVFSPALDIFVGIRPEQVTEQACVGHVCGSHDPLDLVEG